MRKKVYFIEVRSNMTQSAYYVSTIEGKDLYSLSPNDAYIFDEMIDAEVVVAGLDTLKIKHQVIEHIFED